ncbi:MAG: lysophospholipase [Candidatus Saganbacteria bacterium]|nr:lysophospholipase [Candidatus Saganbacteria bacterium]
MPELIGTDILYRKWETTDPKAVLLLVHGLGAHSARWDFLGDYFAARGFPGYALELKGFGATPERPRGHIASFDIYYADILELHGLIAKEHPGRKVFLLAESLGGLIAFIMACRHPDKFAGQVLISPAFQNGMKFKLSAYLTLISQIFINPKRTVDIPFTSAMCTRDPAYQQVMNNNPDEVRVASLKLLMNVLFAQLAALKLAGSLRLPTLFLIAGKDYLVNERAGRQLFQKLPLKDKALIEYPEMLHALSIDLGREQVFADILGWLEKRA